MTVNLPEALEPYPEISSKAYEHPADRAATAALKSVPMLDTVVRKLVEFRYERALRQFYLGNSVKVSERQLPAAVGLATGGVHQILDMPDEYDLYVSDLLQANAHTIGSKAPIIVFDSTLLERLGPGEQRVVLAHELGHILSDHVLYMTALDILLRAGVNLPSVFGLPLRAVRAVLLEWRRAAELSCDRAATLAVRDPRIVCRTLMVTAAGMPADPLDLDAFMAQAMEYESWDDSERPRPTLLPGDRRHPLLRRAPRLRGDDLGPQRRVRPHHPRRVSPPRRHPGGPRGGRRRHGVLRRALPQPVPRARRQRHHASARRSATSASRCPTGCARAPAGPDAGLTGRGSGGCGAGARRRWGLRRSILHSRQPSLRGVSKIARQPSPGEQPSPRRRSRARFCSERDETVSACAKTATARALTTHPFVAAVLRDRCAAGSVRSRTCSTSRTRMPADRFGMASTPDMTSIPNRPRASGFGDFDRSDPSPRGRRSRTLAARRWPSRS